MTVCRKMLCNNWLECNRKLQKERFSQTHTGDVSKKKVVVPEGAARTTVVVGVRVVGVLGGVDGVSCLRQGTRLVSFPLSRSRVSLGRRSCGRRARVTSLGRSRSQRCSAAALLLRRQLGLVLGRGVVQQAIAAESLLAGAGGCRKVPNLHDSPE